MSSPLPRSESPSRVGARAPRSCSIASVSSRCRQKSRSGCSAQAIGHVGNEGPVELGKLEALFAALSQALDQALVQAPDGAAFRRTLAGGMVTATLSAACHRASTTPQGSAGDVRRAPHSRLNHAKNWCNRGRRDALECFSPAPRRLRARQLRITRLVPLAGGGSGHTLDRRGIRHRPLSRLHQMQAVLSTVRFNKDT